MKKRSNFQYILIVMPYLLLVCQVWVNVLSYSQWIVDHDSELIELLATEDGESEEKEDKKEKDDKLLIDLLALKKNCSEAVANLQHLEILPIIYHPERITPPPERLSFF